RQCGLQIQPLLPDVGFEHRIEFEESLFDGVTVGDGLSDFGFYASTIPERPRHVDAHVPRGIPLSDAWKVSDVRTCIVVSPCQREHRQSARISRHTHLIGALYPKFERLAFRPIDARLADHGLRPCNRRWRRS